MHEQDHQLSVEMASWLDSVGGESLNGSGFEAEQSEIEFAAVELVMGDDVEKQG